MVASKSAPVSLAPDALTPERVESRSILRRAWLAVSSVLAAGLGLAPHVLHHAGPLAGAALDDPEGWQVYERIQAEAGGDPSIHVFTNLIGVGNIEVNGDRAPGQGDPAAS